MYNYSSSQLGVYLNSTLYNGELQRAIRASARDGLYSVEGNRDLYWAVVCTNAAHCLYNITTYSTLQTSDVSDVGGDRLCRRTHGEWDRYYGWSDNGGVFDRSNFPPYMVWLIVLGVLWFASIVSLSAAQYKTRDQLAATQRRVYAVALAACVVQVLYFTVETLVAYSYPRQVNTFACLEFAFTLQSFDMHGRSVDDAPYWYPYMVLCQAVFITLVALAGGCVI